MLQENNPLRARIAILGFVGRFAKSLFGISTEEDITILTITDSNTSKLTRLNDAFQRFPIIHCETKQKPTEPGDTFIHYITHGKEIRFPTRTGPFDKNFAYLWKPV